MKVLYEFGPYVLDPDNRLLTKEGQTVALAPKTLDLLLILVRSGGRALSKAEMMQSLWPDTFVEEANLSFQISTLRKALGDEGPKWIETVPKHGYRFAAMVVQTGQQEPAAPFKPRRPLWVVGLGLMAAFAVVLFLIAERHAGWPGPITYKAVPLTDYPGVQAEPSLSPNGNQVAFSWNGRSEDNFDIYVRLVGPGNPVRLTTAPERDVAPAWSPDGRQLAFLRYYSRQNASVFVIPALGGGVEHKISDVVLPLVQHNTTLSWSRDSKQIAVSGRFHNDEPFGIWLVRYGAAPRRLTTAAADVPFDTSPAFSPDHRRLAFIRVTKDTERSLYIQQLTDTLEAVGAPVPLTDGRISVNAISWLDDRRIVFCEGRSAQRHLRIVELESGRVEQTAGFGEGARSVSSASNGSVVYAREAEQVNLWQFDLSSPQRRPRQLAASIYQSWTPAYSHDGSRIAFASTRSGLEEIWVTDSDGAHSVQLTTIGSGHTSNPRWSPDDRTLLFNSWNPSSDLYTVNVKDGSLKRLTMDSSGNIEPSWSQDGKWIYFGNRRSGRYEICRIPAAGGPMAQITRNGGLHAKESIDQKWLYYSKDANAPSSIWRVPRDGGDELRVIDRLSYSTNFATAQHGIYYVSAERGFDGPAAIEFYDFLTGSQTVLVKLDKPITFGLALSSDGRSLVLPLVDHVSSNLMLVEGFR